MLSACMQFCNLFCFFCNPSIGVRLRDKQYGFVHVHSHNGGYWSRSTKIKGRPFSQSLWRYSTIQLYTRSFLIDESEPHKAPKPLWKPSAARPVLVCSVNLCGEIFVDPALAVHPPQPELLASRSVVKATF